MDIFDKYKEDRVPRELLYVLSRAGLYLAVNLFAVLAATIICSAFSTVFSIVFADDYINTRLAPLLTAQKTSSFLSFLLTVLIMLRIFWDDGKRNTAYGKFSMPLVTIAVFVMFVCYAVPSVLIVDTKEALDAFIRIFYRPSNWVSGFVDGDLLVRAVLASAITCTLCLICYKLSGDVYLKKHPEMYDDQ